MVSSTMGFLRSTMFPRSDLRSIHNSESTLHYLIWSEFGTGRGSAYIPARFSGRICKNSTRYLTIRSKLLQETAAPELPVIIVTKVSISPMRRAIQ